MNLGCKKAYWVREGCGSRSLTASQHQAAEMRMKRLVALQEASWAEEDSQTERSDLWDDRSRRALALTLTTVVFKVT